MSCKVRLALLLFCILHLLLVPVEPKDCTKALDVVFVHVAASETSVSHWNVMTNLTKDASDQLHPSNYGTHVALVQYSSNSMIVHRLASELSVNNDSMYVETGGNLVDAMNQTRRLVLNNRGSDRPEVQDVMVIISHRPSDDRNAAINAASEVNSEGVRIITVGVTNTQVDQLREELRKIATDPEDIDHLMLLSPNSYTSVLTFLVETICKDGVEAANESLRLADGTSNSGRLETYINEEWVTFCSTNWTDVNTKIACKELGFPDGQIMYFVNHTSYFRRVGVDKIQCIGNENRLLECPHNQLFHVDSSCDHSHDVFLQCLCGNCGDKSSSQYVRLQARQWTTTGRLEVFSPQLRWGGVCGDDWTKENTRVACRQMGFLNGAGTVESDIYQSIPFVLFSVNCSGNESSVFDCSYYTSPKENCSHAVYIQCECYQCPHFVLQSPKQQKTMTHSSVVIQWQLASNVSSFQIEFLSQKNPQTLVNVSGGKVVIKPTRFRDRIELININGTTVGLKLNKIAAADMGTYALYVPQLLFDSQAVLIVDDFAVVPDPVIRYRVNDRVVLRWDLTPLRHVNYINYDIVLTTPATGRIPLDYYYDQWLKFNSGRHVILQLTQKLHPTIIIEEVAVNDAGIYSIDVKVTSHIRPWINASWHLSANLIITRDFSTSPPLNNSDDDITPSATHINISLNDRVNVNNVHPSVNSTVPVVTIVLGVILGLSLIAIIIGVVLIWWCRTRTKVLADEHERAEQRAQAESQRAELAEQREDEAQRAVEQARQDAEEASVRANAEESRREEVEGRERLYVAELTARMNNQSPTPSTIGETENNPRYFELTRPENPDLDIFEPVAPPVPPKPWQLNGNLVPPEHAHNGDSISHYRETEDLPQAENGHHGRHGQNYEMQYMNVMSQFIT